MIIYSKTYREKCEVLAIAISIDKKWSESRNITLYIRTSGQIGLGTESFSNSEIIDKHIGDDCKTHYFMDGDGVVILWDFFSDIGHLSRLIDLEPETIASFEKAYALRSVGA